MTARLSKLATALTVIFIISLVTLLAELFYVLWRRRIFHRRTQNLASVPGAAQADNNSQISSDTSSTFASFSSTSSSKELLYFFCLNSKEIPRVESKSAPPNVNSTGSAPEDEVIDVFKLQNMYGPSRVLFTIKEEEKEADFESDKSLCSSAEKETEQHSKRISLEDLLKLKLAEETPPEVKVEVGDDHDRINTMGVDEMTPFSTPCESPSYFTPTASPTQEVDTSGKVKNGPSNEQMRSSSKVEV